LATVNLLLGMFNLVPGAPLDGGRVLRALIWRRHGDRDRATVTAARAGQAVGYGLVILGLLAFVYGDTVDGVWFVLIGWFLMSAARQEGELGATDQLLRGITVGDVMSAPVDAGDAETTVRDFIEHRVLAQKHSAYPVTDADGTVVGLVTLAQLRTVPQSARDTAVVRDVALPTEHVAVAAPGDALTALLPRLTRESGGRALVIEDGRLRGIVTPTDVARVVELRQLVRPD
jgi:CBS domain-containing protein